MPKKVTVENKPYIEGMRMIRQSNASGIHLDKRYRRIRTRNAAIKNAVKESING